jgi:hypothetical protein
VYLLNSPLARRRIDRGLSFPRNPWRTLGTDLGLAAGLVVSALIMMTGCAQDDAALHSQAPRSQDAQHSAPPSPATETTAEPAARTAGRAEEPRAQGDGGQVAAVPSGPNEPPAGTKIDPPLGAADLDDANVLTTMKDPTVAPQGPAAQAPPVSSNHPLSPELLRGKPGRSSTETVTIDGKYEVPVVSAGRSIQRSALENAPGYRPPDDPELDAVERGRRLVAEQQIILEGGMPSAESLADMILYCLEEGDATCLHDMRVTGVEFETYLWDEFPESRPATHIEAKHAWFFLHHTCWSGVSAILSDHGGQPLLFKKISASDGYIRYTNFNMLSGVRIHAENEHGEEVIIDNAHTFCEANGVWKVYLYKD